MDRDVWKKGIQGSKWDASRFAKSIVKNDIKITEIDRVRPLFK